jgi:hydrogenase expression/formation protein HypE
MKINMSHGSGGKASSELMTAVFAKHFSNSILDKMEDAAVLTVSGRIAFSTDTFVVTPLFFRGGDIGKLSVCGTVNDLLVMGAVPQYLSVGFILEEGLEIAELEKIAISMRAAADEAGVRIVAGDTKVVEGSGGLYINTSGIGLIPEGRSISAANCRPGDVFILSGTLGDHHACILSARMKIENNIASDCAPLNDVIGTLFEVEACIRTMRDVTRGGLGTILNELADTSGCAIEIEETALPVSEAVKGFTSILGLDPMYMANEGKVLIVVAEQDAAKALEAMRQTEHGRDAAMIGRATAGSGVSMITAIGGRRTIDVLYGEGLPRIC